MRSVWALRCKPVMSTRPTYVRPTSAVLPTPQWENMTVCTHLYCIASILLSWMRMAFIGSVRTSESPSVVHS
ncbi:hypothetical protein OH76DRAFT_666874 [Lentinus brumalis]|uniref:Uncharacterized protein n=1 Tax=Lentinus brumalis TaxID=2498619 RepID=A0A371D713_9APHY|nr:hypothetical protein OH76DRAFT_666874 [Polyporus brumalis]